MKLTKSQLKQIIKEELSKLLSEFDENPGLNKEPNGQDQEMKNFVQEEFVEEAKYDRGMSMDEFDMALEKFEVKYNLDFPDSVFKLYDVFLEMNEDSLANRLKIMYEPDFEDREFRQEEEEYERNFE